MAVDEGSVALVVATVPRALTVVGGLPLAVRAVLALRRSGAGDVAVVAGRERPRLQAALERRGVAVRWLGTGTDAAVLPRSGPVAVVPGDTLVDEAGVRRAPRCPVEAFPRLLAALLAGRTPSEALEGAGVAAAPLWGDGLWVPSESAASPRDLETALLTHLGRRTAAGDSYLAALVDRRAARPLTRLVLPWTRITPSHVTLLAIAAGVTGAAGLATTSYVSRLGGAVLLVVSIWLDCVDGEVARARYEQSPAGARLDVLGDYLVHLAVFGALAFGLVRQRAGAAAAWAGAGLLGGVVTAMALLHLLFIRPALSRGGDIHWAGDGDTLRGTPVATVVEKLASRDYTYLLLACALADRLHWFVYATAVGSWLFVTALIGWWWSIWRRAGRREAVVS